MSVYLTLICLPGSSREYGKWHHFPSGLVRVLCAQDSVKLCGCGHGQEVSPAPKNLLIHMKREYKRTAH